MKLKGSSSAALREKEVDIGRRQSSEGNKSTPVPGLEVTQGRGRYIFKSYITFFLFNLHWKY